ncbi:MAG: RNA polymerase sigma-I factor [Bacillota bacterium]|nr:RNA polymerase sigma-I factor [Bacillota bacterium]MDW7678079.1 RNA polymerase sigma-I factor [Bacillota bacterium]
MFFLLNTTTTESEINPVLTSLAEIRQGNEVAREDFIHQYDPFILNTAAKVTGRFVDKQNDDEYSIALIAFNRAIDTFDHSKGQSFFAYAKVLVRNDLIDHFRSEGRIQERTLSDTESTDTVFLEDKTPAEAMAMAREMDDKMILKNEIALFRSALQDYGIPFSALLKETPKHEDTRRQLVALTFQLYNHPEVREEIRRTGKLPLKQLENMVKVSRKTLERHRRYLMAGFILLDSDLDTMKDYFYEAL